jgi:NAD(P)-dependent dehydrogenase (short-subunit alcohol dehydrogenase family)
MIDFSNHVVLVTGAAGGIGAATARTIARCGGDVVLHDLKRGERLNALQEELGGQARVVTSDLADPRSAAPLWREALAWRERIDVLINNAGIYEPASVDDDLERWTAAWNRMLAINLVSPATLCREAIRTFRGQDGGGTIVNLASRAAWRGEDAEYGHYAAAKAGGGGADEDDRSAVRP